MDFASSFFHHSVSALGAASLVSSLFLLSGGWNVPLVKASFQCEESEAILSIPHGSAILEDSCLWHFEKDGAYSVKSGYKLGKSLLGRNAASVAEHNGLWWKALWKLGIPPKIRIFIWKCCFHWIPTKLNLATRGVPSDFICPICLRCPESTTHALWGV